MRAFRNTGKIYFPDNEISLAHFCTICLQMPVIYLYLFIYFFFLYCHFFLTAIPQFPTSTRLLIFIGEGNKPYSPSPYLTYLHKITTFFFSNTFTMLLEASSRRTRFPIPIQHFSFLLAIAEAYNTEGNERYREEDLTNAIHFYTEGIQVNCKDEELKAELYSNRAEAYFCLG